MVQQLHQGGMETSFPSFLSPLLGPQNRMAHMTPCAIPCRPDGVAVREGDIHMIVFEEGDYEVSVCDASATVHVGWEVSYEELEPVLRELERSLDAIERSGAS